MSDAPAAEAAPPEVLVLVVSTRLFHELGEFQGLSREPEKYLDVLLKEENGSFLPKDAMEKDPTFKQLIPYVVFRHEELHQQPRYLVYTRTKKQGEKRLHGKRSLGIGGHIESKDATTKEPYEVGMRRELAEEVVTTDDNYKLSKPVALINDDSNEVGKVHLGVVHFADTRTIDIKPTATDEMVEVGFWTAGQLVMKLEEFESWSQIVIQQLLAAGRGTLQPVG